MSLQILEKRWTKALTDIVDELRDDEYQKLLSFLDKIPTGTKSGKARGEMPLIIIQYYGLEKSITAINKSMEDIPRMDSKIQVPLRPFVDRMKQNRQKNKGKQVKVTGVTAAKSQKPSAAPDQQLVCQPDKKKKKTQNLQSCSVAHEATSGVVKEKPGEATSHMKLKTDAVGPVKPKKPKKQESKPGESSLKSQATEVFRNQTDAVGPVKPKKPKKQESLWLKPGGLSSGSQAAEVFRNQTDAVGPVKPKQPKKKKESLWLKPGGLSSHSLMAEVFLDQPGGSSTMSQTTKVFKDQVQSPPVQTVRVKITKLVKFTQKQTHLCCEVNQQVKTLVVTSPRLAKAFGFMSVNDIRGALMLPLSAEVKIKGEKIIDINPTMNSYDFLRDV